VSSDTTRDALRFPQVEVLFFIPCFNEEPNVRGASAQDLMLLAAKLSPPL